MPAYPDLAVRLGVQESTLRSHITRLRARYREALRAEVRRTVETEAEVDGELRELLRVLTAAEAKGAMEILAGPIAICSTCRRTAERERQMSRLPAARRPGRP